MGTRGQWGLSSTKLESKPLGEEKRVENKKTEKKILKNSKLKLNLKLKCNVIIETDANNNKLNCFYANARSLVNKMEELEL